MIGWRESVWYTVCAMIISNHCDRLVSIPTKRIGQTINVNYQFMTSNWMCLLFFIEFERYKSIYFNRWLAQIWIRTIIIATNNKWKHINWNRFENKRSIVWEITVLIALKQVENRLCDWFAFKLNAIQSQFGFLSISFEKYPVSINHFQNTCFLVIKNR